MTFTITTEIAIWLVLVTAGLVSSGLSAHRASIVYRSIRARHALPDVIEDSRHVYTHQRLLVLGWLIFAVIGTVATLDPQTATPRPVTPFGQLILWGLLGAVATWTVMTVIDYIYTLRIEFRERHRLTESESLSRQEQAAVSNEEQRALSQKVNEAQLDAIAATGDDTHARVMRVEAATVDTDKAVAEHTSTTDERLDALEARKETPEEEKGTTPP